MTIDRINGHGNRYSPEPRDELRHRLHNTPYARESTVYDIHIPDHGTISLYTWVNGSGRAGMASVFFGPLAGEKAVFETADDVQMRAEDDFRDWRVGPLSIAVEVPLTTAHVELAGRNLEVIADFEAMHPAFMYSKSYDRPEEGCPPFLAAHRYEQSGRLVGEFILDGQRFEFDTFGHRDHSWGRRDWALMQNFRWIEAQTESSAVNIMWVNAFGREYHLGYVYKDGLLSAIRDIKFDIRYDDRWVQDDVHVAIVDADRRRTSVDAVRYGRHEYPIGDTTKLVDTAVIVHIDGEPGLGYTDWSWPIEYLTLLRTRGRSLDVALPH